MNGQTNASRAVIVMAVTRTRLRAAGMRYAGLAPFADIEAPADPVHLPAGWLAS